MLQGKHSEILLTFIKLPFVIKIFVLSIFEWPLKTGFTDTLDENPYRAFIVSDVYYSSHLPMLYGIF